MISGEANPRSTLKDSIDTGDTGPASPERDTLPEDGAISPARIFSRVLLPEPLGPVRAMERPEETESPTPEKILPELKRFDIFSADRVRHSVNLISLKILYSHSKMLRILFQVFLKVMNINTLPAGFSQTRVCQIERHSP